MAAWAAPGSMAGGGSCEPATRPSLTQTYSAWDGPNQGVMTIHWRPLPLIGMAHYSRFEGTSSPLLPLSATARTETIRVVIIRVARFDEASVIGRDWITDALRGVPGVRAAYHAVNPGQAGYISVAIADDEQAMEAGTQAIARRRAELGIASLGPDEVSVYVVDHFVENLNGEDHS